MIRVSGLCLAIGLISAPAFGQGCTVPEGFIVDTGPRGGAGGGGVHQIVVLAQPGGDPVVHHHAILVEHEAVAAAADS